MTSHLPFQALWAISDMNHPVQLVIHACCEDDIQLAFPLRKPYRVSLVFVKCLNQSQSQHSVHHARHILQIFSHGHPNICLGNTEMRLLCMNVV